MSHTFISTQRMTIYVVIICLQLHLIITGCTPPPKPTPGPLPVELQQLPRKAWYITPFSDLLSELPPQYQLDDEDRYYQGKEVGYIAWGEEVTIVRYIWSDVNSSVYGGYWVYIQTDNLAGWTMYSKGFGYEGTVEPDIYFDEILKKVPAVTDTALLSEVRIDVTKKRDMRSTCAYEAVFHAQKSISDTLKAYYDVLHERGWYLVDDLQADKLTKYLRMRESSIADVTVFAVNDPTNMEKFGLLSSLPITETQQLTIYAVRVNYEGPIKGCSPAPK